MNAKALSYMSIGFFIFFMAITYINVDRVGNDQTFLAIVGALGAEKSLDYLYIRRKK